MIRFEETLIEENLSDSWVGLDKKKKECQKVIIYELKN